MCTGGAGADGARHSGGEHVGMPLVRGARPSPVPLLVATDGMPVPKARGDRTLSRVRHGVYAATDRWRALLPWERYLARVHAVALVRPGTVFCLESAAALLGMPLFGEPRDIHVLDSRPRSSHRQGDVVLHTSLDPRATVALGEITVTAPAETVVDLVRVLPPAFALAVADAAVSARQLGMCRLEDLVGIGDRQVNRRGRRTLEWTWQRVDDRIESVGEAVSQAVIEWLGFPAPAPQQTFHFEGFEDRPDFFWEDCDAIGESDGYGKYDGQDAAASRSLFVKEKIREDRLRRHVRGFARWDWADVMRAAPLRQKLLSAGIPQLFHPQPAMLATLTSRRRPSASRDNRPSA